VVFFTDKIEKFIPPRKGRNHILQIIRELLSIEPKSSQTNISVALQFLSQTIKKRSIAFVISDFADISPYEKHLRTVARQHDFIGIEIYDRFERELPKAGLLLVKDAESGNQFWVDTENEEVRKNFHLNQQEKQNRLKNTFAKNGADLLQIHTGQNYFGNLHRFFLGRARK
jgi:uncharacterized protein (DUF58 family)